MRIGIGDTATPASGTTPAVGNTTAPPSFMTGLQLWLTPTSAIQYLTATVNQPATAFSSAMLPATIGVLLPPIALIALIARKK